jgi:hypothetical protein
MHQGKKLLANAPLKMWCGNGKSDYNAATTASLNGILPSKNRWERRIFLQLDSAALEITAQGKF